MPDKNLITPDRQDILSAPKGLPSGAEAPLSEPEALTSWRLGRSLSRRPVPPIDSYYQ
ncbi:MAG: hypothetical protein Q7V12_05520 [Deltaproteobacteria bacterium]|nr:hypothetical protein [Deltaproteobacteria bacterium]